MEGGKKAAATNKQRYGLDFYKGIGRHGGTISRGGGFPLGSEKAREAGRKGGLASRMGVNNTFQCEFCPIKLKTSASRSTHVSHIHRSPKVQDGPSYTIETRVAKVIPLPIDVTMPKKPAEDHPWRRRISKLLGRS